MLPYIIAAHAPALTCAEAALLPALSGAPELQQPRNMLIPYSHLQFRPALPQPQSAPCRGSMAGRAVLHAGGISLPGLNNR